MRCMVKISLEYKGLALETKRDDVGVYFSLMVKYDNSKMIAVGNNKM